MAPKNPPNSPETQVFAQDSDVLIVSVSKLRVLVVDDEPLVCEMVKAMLMQDGHFVDTAPGGKEGLTRFDADHFDLVLADYRMPKMKGDQFAAAIKKRLQPKPVIMITGHPPDEAPKGIDWVLLKPFSLLQLRLAISDVLEAQDSIN
jgi:CheY-like chemotaxis protein